jgi:hypothetical protein
MVEALRAPAASLVALLTTVLACITRLTILRSVSIPVSSSSKMPRSETASTIAFCSGPVPKMACCACGQIVPKTEGPSTLLLLVGRLLGECMPRIGQPAVMGQLIGGIVPGAPP